MSISFEQFSYVVSSAEVRACGYCIINTDNSIAVKKNLNFGRRYFTGNFETCFRLALYKTRADISCSMKGVKAILASCTCDSPRNSQIE